MGFPSKKLLQIIFTGYFQVCRTLIINIKGKYSFFLENISLKGNLAHKFMDIYFLCLSFHLDIYDMLKTKNIGNLG